jgi:hypothetical protein
MSLGGVEVTFEIDSSKVTILTRAARLRGWAVDYLTELRATAEGTGHLPEEVVKLDEILTWLNEMET